MDIEVENPLHGASQYRPIAMESDFLNKYCPIWHAIGEGMHALCPPPMSRAKSGHAPHHAIIQLGSGFDRRNSRYIMRIRLVFPDTIVERRQAIQIRHYVCNRLQMWLNFERDEVTKMKSTHLSAAQATSLGQLSVAPLGTNGTGFHDVFLVDAEKQDKQLGK